MAESQCVDAQDCIHCAAADLMARFGHLNSGAFKVAVRLDVGPPVETVDTHWIRDYLQVGANRAARVYKDLKAAGLLPSKAPATPKA